jgi:nucleotide-binding universal stress UspA family protein
MKVIVGVDDSPCSKAALRWVRESRWPPGTTFVIVSAVELAAYTLVEPGSAAVYQQVREGEIRSRAALVAGAEAEFSRAQLAVKGRVEDGDPRDILVRVAESERADLVVVGSHGRTGLPRLLMGSVASHVVAHAPCNVLVVKRGAEGTRS